jgi:hypothetical protein
VQGPVDTLTACGSIAAPKFERFTSHNGDSFSTLSCPPWLATWPASVGGPTNTEYSVSMLTKTTGKALFVYSIKIKLEYRLHDHMARQHDGLRHRLPVPVENGRCVPTVFAYLHLLAQNDLE